jgi:hypothetical protein
MTDKRFRIALSFAGDKRPFVAEVARLLARQLGEDRVLYDQFHVAEFARGDLALHLPRLYHEQSDLVVAVLCEGYAHREWCGLEWNAIFGMMKQGRYEQVMLTRFDLAEAQGMFNIPGYCDLDDLSAEQAATLILERLAQVRGRARNQDGRPPAAESATDWPLAPPPLDWPVADHSDAQRAFAQLLTRDTPFRLLSIYGHSETGKSHLTRQFVRNALKIPQLACGRFDFKGSIDMRAEAAAFAERLGVPPATQGSLSDQLRHILEGLKRRAAPTLLVFDTFEMAGEAERWVKESMLPALLRSCWLRVVVVGQAALRPHGEIWADCGEPPIELRPPSAQEWFDFGRTHRPELTLEFVNQVHELARGKSGLLAQLLSPP